MQQKGKNFVQKDLLQDIRMKQISFLQQVQKREVQMLEEQEAQMKPIQEVQEVPLEYKSKSTKENKCVLF